MIKLPNIPKINLSKKTKILLILCYFLVIILYIITRNDSEKENTTPPQSKVGKSWQNITPGITTIDDLQNSNKVPIKTIPGNTHTTYILKDDKNQAHSLEINNNTGQVEFIQENLQAKTYLKDCIEKYGQYDFWVYDNNLKSAKAYIYLDQGFAVSAHTQDNSVLYIWYFPPTTEENFKNQWSHKISNTDQLIDILDPIQ